MILINKNMYLSADGNTLWIDSSPPRRREVEESYFRSYHRYETRNSAKVTLSTATVGSVRTVNVPAFSAVMLRWGPSYKSRTNGTARFGSLKTLLKKVRPLRIEEGLTIFKATDLEICTQPQVFFHLPLRFGRK